MKAIVCTRYGSPDALELRDVATPRPKANEVLIRIHATTVTMGDCEVRASRFPLWLWPLIRLYMGPLKPRIKVFGQEVAGEVEAVGSEVTHFKPGDQVFAPTTISLGAHAEYICLPAEYAIATKPLDVSYEQAAAIPVGGLNALYFLRKANLQAGQKILINGAGGSIGSFAVQLAKFYGAEVTAVDSANKQEMLCFIGADHFIDYTRQDFRQGGKQYDVVFDVVGKSSLARCAKILTPTGIYVSANPKVADMVQGAWAAMTRSRKRVITGATEYTREDLAYLVALVAAGKIAPYIDRRYNLAEVPAAHRYVDSGEKKGCVVVTVS